MGTDQGGSRLAYLDQFRGYTVLGMFFVNFVGGYVAIPAIFKHWHTYCSYADTIMPQFLFAVGFAYRLTFRRRFDKGGARAAYLRALGRNLALIVIGLVVHHLDGRYDKWETLGRTLRETFDERGILGVLMLYGKRSPFQALTHIGVTCLWVLPVIGAPSWVRGLYALASAALFVGLSQWFYFDYVLASPPGIDGGPLGFLTWTIPLVVGSLACDFASDRGGVSAMGRWTVAAVLLMAVGYGLACLDRVTPPNHLPADASWTAALVEPPFVPPPEPNIGKAPPRTQWVMSQRAGSASYLVFSSGFGLLVLVLFVVLNAAGWHSRYLDFLGQNALAGYIIHDLVFDAVKPFVPKDAPLWYVLVGFATALALVSALLHWIKVRI